MYICRGCKDCLRRNQKLVGTKQKHRELPHNLILDLSDSQEVRLSKEVYSCKQSPEGHSSESKNIKADRKTGKYARHTIDNF